MAIPVSSVVDVSISIGAVFPSRAGFGTMLIVTNQTDVVGPAERIRFYSTADSASAEWGASSEVAKAANTYFAQQPKPTRLGVAVRYDSDQSAQLRGGSDPITEISTWTAITDGEFNITIDGTNADVSAIDFTGDTTMAQVAATIDTKLKAADVAFAAATCTWDGTRFYINSGTTGVTSTIDAFLTDVDPAVGTSIVSQMDMAQGNTTYANGFAGETITESLTAIQTATERLDSDQGWYGFIFTKEVRDLVQVNGEDAVEAAAAWAEARIKIFGNIANSGDVLDSVSTTDIASVLSTQSLRRTITFYSSKPDEYVAASAFGRAFTVNFNQPNSTITLKFKQAPTVTVENLTENQKGVLDSKNANALIQVGDSIFFAESFMSNGTFFDETHGVDWLQDAIQTNVFGALVSSPTKIPYTDPGVQILAQAVTNALNEGVRNGLLAPGETIDGRFLSNGYEVITIPVADINQSDREARLYPGLSFTAIGAGAIHSVQIQGVFER